MTKREEVTYQCDLCQHQSANAMLEVWYSAALGHVCQSCIEAIEKAKERRGKRQCPECRKWVEKTCHECGMTFGRRGWRQLGVYDG